MRSGLAGWQVKKAKALQRRRVQRIHTMMETDRNLVRVSCSDLWRALLRRPEAGTRYKVQAFMSLTQQLPASSKQESGDSYLPDQVVRPGPSLVCSRTSGLLYFMDPLTRVDAPSMRMMVQARDHRQGEPLSDALGTARI